MTLPLSVKHAGEMGERILAFDWSRTPLGLIEGWPDVLRVTLGTMLASRFPKLLWWGPEMLQLYNQAYRPVLGAKHPHALGRPGPEVWAEIWDIIGPLAEGVRAGGAPTFSEHLHLPMQRRGFLEETYFTFSYSPVYEGAQVAGVLVTCQETTSHVVGERQMRMLQELAAMASQRADVSSAVDAAARALGRDDADVPFSLIFLAGSEPRLAAASGGADRVEFLRDPGTWPLAQTAEAWTPVPLPARDDLPLGRWSSPPVQAVCLPLPRAGSLQPWGHLVVGLSPVRELDPSYAGFLGLAADHIGAAIGAARASEEERRRLEALAELDRAKTVFFSNASHELRTPLTLMLGPIDELLASPLPEGTRPVVELLHHNARRLQRLVNGLLDFASIEGGRAHAPAPVDLPAFTRELCAVFRAAMERAGLELRVDVPPFPRPVPVDPAMWEKILLNLLSNAFKFTLEGHVEVRLREEGDRVVLTVSDTGTGIPAAELPRLFRRFHRVTSARARTLEGSGIGLALVHELARLHGGTVEVESREGAGSTFRVAIPRGPTSGAAIAAQPSTMAGDWGDEALRLVSPHAPVAAPRVDGPLVLAADDNADMRDYLRRLLSERWRVITAADGIDALNLARLEQPDLVLTDVMMPGLDGFELLRELRRDPGTGRIPVILLTARAGEEASVEGLAAGADDYLVKPFGARELLARVQAQLSMAGARRAAEDASRAKDEFLAMLGHELRNPLSPILTALQMLRLRHPDTARREREVIERQVQHLVRLVDDLMDVSRITQGKLEMLRRPFELRDAVDRALEQAAPLLEQHRHHLEVHVPAGLVIDGDVDRMAQVIANLLTNAAKYTDPGGHVVVSGRGDGEGVELSVRDDGRGIEPELLPQLFDRFVQGRQSFDRSQGGLGLGLSIVRNLTRLHGGEVTVESSKGQGTTFTLHLPRSAAATPHRPAPEPRGGTRSGRVLVVDDNVDAAEMLAELLEREGFEVRAAHDGPGALALAGVFRPQVALLDLGLPVMDGFELARRLRDQEGSIGLLALTGYGQPSDRRRSLEAGFDEHLVKPVDLDVVIPAVERLLDRGAGEDGQRPAAP